MSATLLKQTYTLVIVNKPMNGTDRYSPRIICYEVDRNYIIIKKKEIMK